MRHDWKAAHGFRKFYKSRAEQIMRPIKDKIRLDKIIQYIQKGSLTEVQN